MRTRPLSLPRWSAIAVAGAVLLTAQMPLAAQAAPSTYQASGTVDVGARPTDVAFNATTNMIYVANTDDNTVSAINGSTGAVTDTFSAGLMANPSQPSSIAVNEGTNTVYVANSNTDPATPGYNTVSKIDIATGVLTHIPVALYPYAMAVNETTNKIYVANLSHSVTEIDGATGAVRTINVGNVFSQPTAITVNETTNKIYAVDYIGSELFEIDGASFTWQASQWVGGNPFGVAVNEATNTIYTTSFATDTVRVLDGATRAIVSTIAVGDAPFEIQVDDSRNTVFVANGDAGTVSVIDGATNTVASTVAVGASTRALALNTAANTVYATRDGNKLSIIDALTPPVITTTDLAPAVVGAAYSATIGATGSGPITFAVTSGALPAGLALDPATGILSGTPTSAGPSSFTVTATGTVGSDSHVFTFSTNEAPAITTDSLPDGIMGQEYSATLTATGTAPFTFAVAAGVLPAGLALDPATGIISGTPTAAGAASFTVTATNAAGTAEQAFTITTAPAPVTPVEPAVPVAPVAPAAPIAPTEAAPALAETGVEALPWAAGSGLVLIAGAVLFLLGRSRRRATA
ncbi:putative Ig domain-containing protein [Arthrobacter sp. 35W]|uniref:putative Ig domain-containing protein n=1 Tax=Arthrobacter sp. 35W TaxID=1132441 RepID=UPI00041A4262|nr:putative Ig domain-containing protein [Arthrobacter sp. 35W]